jgi:hypothetical protein
VGVKFESYVCYFYWCTWVMKDGDMYQCTLKEYVLLCVAEFLEYRWESNGSKASLAVAVVLVDLLFLSI